MGALNRPSRSCSAGDVELLPDGKAKVASQSNGQTIYYIVNGACELQGLPQGSPVNVQAPHCLRHPQAGNDAGQAKAGSTA